MHIKQWIARLVLLSFVLPFIPVSQAAPPPWAPAHGWRKKHDPYYVGYSGRQWGRDYGIISGECNWQAVGTVLGGVVGGAVGASVAKGDQKVIAVILGSVIGAVIGNQIGKQIDDNDRGCIGHALELAHDRQTVRWMNPNTGLSYRVTPLSGFTQGGKKCRDYNVYISGKGRDVSFSERACMTGNGTWKAI